MIPNYGRNGFFYASAASGDPESPRDNFLRNIKAEKTFHVVLATESILALSGTRALAWPKSRKVRSLGEIGIERLLRNFVILGSPNNPRAKERNSGYIMVRKGPRIQVASARDRRVSAEES
jgi:hypothetical protein